MTWQPTATYEMLHARAVVYAKIRNFFSARNVLEVETPLLCYATNPDPHISSLSSEIFVEGKKQTYYLQTSPEFAMKRLLANDLGAIYQICKAFRADEKGRLHNPEFTLLEWYRVGFDHHQLMDEMDDFLRSILNTRTAYRISYCKLFLKFLEIDPLEASVDTLKKVAQARIADINFSDDNKDFWLDLLMTHCIEPYLGKNNQPWFVYNYPATQAALAKISSDDPRVAERFEVYINGIELANGFHELCDYQEQRKRLQNHITIRELLNLPQVPLDENFLAALNHGLPNCAGVALGIDRLLMVFKEVGTIQEVISFPIDSA